MMTRLLSAVLLLSALASGQSFTLVQLASSSGCGNTTTCSVTASLGAGHILFIGASTVNSGIKVSSINVGGSYVPGWMTNGTQFVDTAYLDGGYVYPTTSTAGPIVVTFSGSTGGAHVDIAEVSFSGGTPSLDALNSYLNTSASNSVGGVGLNLTGSTDVVFQWAVTNTHLTAITAPYSTHAVFPNDETGQGAAISLNTTSGTAPTWTSASGTATSVTGAIAFGISASPCDPSFLVDFSGGTNGVTPAPTDLLNSTFGIAAPGNGNSGVSPGWVLVNDPTEMTYSTTAHHPLSGPMRFCYGGKNYSESNDLGMQETTNGTADEYAIYIQVPQYNYNGLDSADLGTFGVWMMTDIPQTDTGGWIDTFNIWTPGGSNYVNASLETQNPTGLSMHLECCGVATEAYPFPIPTNAWFWVTMQRDASSGGVSQLMVYDANLNPLGVPAIGSTALTGAGYYNAYIAIGRAGGLGSPTAGNHVYFDKLKVCIGQNCPFPLLPTESGIYAPVNGATLTSNSATFQWGVYPGATAYWLDVGSTQGGNNYYSSGSLSTSTFSRTVTTLPSDGSTVWARWYYMLSGAWQYIDYSYTALGGSASRGVITLPAPSSTLNSSSVTFTWTAGSGATAYWLDIGSSAGGNNYYSSGNLGNVLTEPVNGLPTNGSTVNVTLYSQVGGVWLSNAYTYTAFNAAAAAGVLTTPTPGTTLTGSTVTFGWTAGSPGPYSYWMDIGSSAGGNSYYSSGNLGNVTTTPTVYTLPTDGSTVYVTLYTLIGGVWTPKAYTYTALNATSGLAVMQTPIPTSTFTANSVPFTWSADASATAYWIDIGSSAGGNNVWSSGNLGKVFATTDFNVPANGKTIYATLYSLVGGQWKSTSCTYTEALGAIVQSPSPGSTLSGGSATFSWSAAGSGVTGYGLTVGSTYGGAQYYNSGTLSGLTTTATGLPTIGSTMVYVTLYSFNTNNGTQLQNYYYYFSGP